MKTLIYTLLFLSFTLEAHAFGGGKTDPAPVPAPTPAPTPTPVPTPTPTPAPVVGIEPVNLVAGQKLTQGAETLLRVKASGDVGGVKVIANGGSLGFAEYRAETGEFRMTYRFQFVAEFDLKFVAYDKDLKRELATKTVRVSVVRPVVVDPPPPPPTGSNFNAYILKAIAFIDKNYAMLGYNIDSQLTHDLPYHTFGTLKSTFGSQTMCVSAQLEIIVTAMTIYAQETGDYSIFSYLPFRSWNSLASDAIKAHIWVNHELDSYGTADAIAKFGMGEIKKFEELEAGDFINLNRVSRTGHAVTFISYLDIKGNELPRYDAARVVGFKYYSAQGGPAVGDGGMGYRYAFFDKFGCPNVPYYRDCGIIWSTRRDYLNMGQMWHPKDWKRASSARVNALTSFAASEIPAEEGAQFTGRAAKFNGMTTDD